MPKSFAVGKEKFVHIRTDDADRATVFIVEIRQFTATSNLDRRKRGDVRGHSLHGDSLQGIVAALSRKRRVNLRADFHAVADALAQTGDVFNGNVGTLCQSFGKGLRIAEKILKGSFINSRNAGAE